MADGQGIPGLDICFMVRREEMDRENLLKSKLYETINYIENPDKDAMEAALKRQQSLAKPPGSLGGLEDISVKMAGITGRVFNEIKRSCVAVFCADNGVAEEGVSSAPQTVTMAQTVNFARRLTGVGVLAESFGSELLIVDMGVKHPIPAELYDKVPLWNTKRIINRKIRPGTCNLAKEPAMSREEALHCIEVGIEMAQAVKNAGYDIMGIGEMGIGNTTTSAAVLSAVTGKSSDETCGKGGGINDKSFMRKKEIVDEVTADWRTMGGLLETADAGSEAAVDGMIDILARMGGFDICAMTGAFIGAAANKIPVVIDGYISVVAALAAYVIEPEAVNYMFASHKSWEKGYELAVEALGLKPFLELGMRLGEGSGCPIAFEVIRGACDVMRNMATFEEAEINDDYLEEIRGSDCF